MGIIFQVFIRCLRVYDIDKVNTSLIHAGEQETWKVRLDEYYAESTKNLECLVRIYKHNPECRSYYSMVDVLLPGWYSDKIKPHVLSFSNNACDRRGDTLYTVSFFDNYGKLLVTEKIISPDEENRFMLRIPEKAATFNYRISPSWDDTYWDTFNELHFYNRSTKCFTCCDCYCTKHHLRDTESESDPDSEATLTADESEEEEEDVIEAAADADADDDDDDDKPSEKKRIKLECDEDLSAIDT